MSARKNGDLAAITAAGNMAAAAMTAISRTAGRRRSAHSLPMPLASTSFEPIRRRTRKVLAMPPRPFSRKSSIEKCVPTATIRDAPLPSASSSAASSLVPGTWKT